MARDNNWRVHISGCAGWCIPCLGEQSESCEHLSFGHWPAANNFWNQQLEDYGWFIKAQNLCISRSCYIHQNHRSMSRSVRVCWCCCIVRPAPGCRCKRKVWDGSPLAHNCVQQETFWYGTLEKINSNVCWNILPRHSVARCVAWRAPVISRRTAKTRTAFFAYTVYAVLCITNMSPHAWIDVRWHCVCVCVCVCTYLQMVSHVCLYNFFLLLRSKRK